MDEIKNELDALDEEERRAYAELQAKTQDIAQRRQAVIAKMMSAQKREEPPMFDDTERTVQWESGCKKLSKQRYNLFTSLMVAPNQCLTLDELQDAGWCDTEGVVASGTIRTAICRLGADLLKSGAPWYLDSVMSEGGDEEVSDADGVRKVRLRRSLVGYRLVARVSDSSQALQNST